MITVIHGPQASGKTHHSKAFKAHFDCDAVVDGWLHRRQFEFSGPTTENMLVLTTEHPDVCRASFPMARIVGIEDAKAALEQASRRNGIAAIICPIPAPDAEGYVSFPRDGGAETVATYLHAGVRIGHARPHWAGGSILIDILAGLRAEDGFDEEGATLLITPAACRQIGQDLIALADAQTQAPARHPDQRPTLKLAQYRHDR